MAASYQTVEAILAAVRRHVSDAQLEAIIADLLTIPGNKSLGKAMSIKYENIHIQLTGRNGNAFAVLGRW
jgi:hypothetical protein